MYKKTASFKNYNMGTSTDPQIDDAVFKTPSLKRQAVDAIWNAGKFCWSDDIIQWTDDVIL